MRRWKGNKEKRKLRRQYISRFYRDNILPFSLAVLSTLLIGALNLVIAWLMQQMINAVSGAPGARSLNTLALFLSGPLS